MEAPFDRNNDSFNIRNTPPFMLHRLGALQATAKTYPIGMPSASDKCSNENYTPNTFNVFTTNREQALRNQAPQRKHELYSRMKEKTADLHDMISKSNKQTHHETIDYLQTLTKQQLEVPNEVSNSAIVLS